MLALIISGLLCYVLFLQTERFLYLLLSALLTTVGILTKLPGLIVLVPIAYATFASLSQKNSFLPSWTFPGIILAIIGLILPPPSHLSPASEDQSRRAPWLFHWWLAGCIALYLIGARELVWNPWNFHVFNIAGAAFAGRAVIWIGSIPWFNGFSPVRLLKMSIPVIVLAWSSVGALRAMRIEYASDDYEVGKALFQISQPADLVVTVPTAIGDPLAIYYSHRHGWLFPPAVLARTWMQYPPDDESSIQMFEQLRAQNARWLGITREPYDFHEPKRTFWEHNRKLIAHIKETCEQAISTPHGVVYRILTPAELAEKKRGSFTPPATNK